MSNSPVRIASILLAAALFAPGAFASPATVEDNRAADGERELLAALPYATPEILPSLQISLAFACYQQGEFADSARYAGEYLKTHPDHSMAKMIFERSQATLAGGTPPRTFTTKEPPPAPPAPSPTPHLR